MTEILRTAWAVAWSGWRANYNRSWRFSRTKTAAIFLLVQLAVVYFITRRAGSLGTSRAGLGAEGLLVLMLTQMAWSGLLRGFAGGQFQLYRGILIPLFQVTPARPVGFLLGRVVQAGTSSLRNGVIWAWAYSSPLPGMERWEMAALMFLAGTLLDLLGFMAGLLMVATISRVSPKSLNNGLFVGFGLTLAAATWAIIYLAQGGTLAELGLLMRAWRPVLLTAGVILLGIPGGLLLGATLLWPEQVENVYQQGLYKVREAQEQETSRPKRSMWVPLPDGPLRGIVAKEWISDVRSVVTRIRLMMWASVTVGVWFAGAAVKGQPLTQAVLLVGALVTLAWAMAWGGEVRDSFADERVTQILYRMAGVPANTLVVGKALAIWLPSLPVVIVPVLVGGLRAGLGFTSLLGLLLWCVAAMTAAVLGGLGIAAATAGEEPDEPEVLAGPRGFGGGQGSQGSTIWLVARNVALAACPALVIWAGAGQPWTQVQLPAWFVLTGAVLLPLVCVALGLTLMRQGWRSPKTRVRAGLFSNPPRV